MKSKGNEVAAINIMQTQVEEMHFTFNLEFRMPLYQEGCYIDCQQSLMLNKA
jgi:hypothetical protein